MAASPTTRPAGRSPLADKAERRRMLQELQSGDSDRIAAATKEVRDGGLHHSTYDLNIFIDAGMYAEAETDSITGTIAMAGNGGACGGFADVRARAYLAEGKPKEALAAAKSCYNVTWLSLTPRAIDLVCDCLVAANPDDPDIARRFRAQQIAGATTQPTTAPSEDSDLGAPILATIKVDSSSLDAAIDKIKGLSYAQLTMKGNLLLVADRPREARKIFEQALRLAHGNKQLTAAVESVARSIRAEAGCVGPANAYIESLRKSQ
ncbi:MAG TPA: hypothetical protein VL992_07095 [Tepidisphaeraceae bacterium]|nr:hypothetical protein [Tepidisphaeraceae bacterium]